MNYQKNKTERLEILTQADRIYFPAYGFAHLKGASEKRLC